MYRLLIFPLIVILAFPAWAQVTGEPETQDTDSTESVADPVEDASDDAAEEGIEEDDELYSEEDEDKFIPSEDVGFGQSIPFPTDI